MNLRPQSGLTLVEVALAAGIVAIGVGGALFAIAAFGKYVAQQAGPARSAALISAQQTLRVAQDAWKYGSPGSAPAGTEATTLPLSAATSAPATITTALSRNGSSAYVTVTVHYTPEPGRSGDSGVVRVSGEVSQKAPIPGAQLQEPGLIPAPGGAP